MDQYAIDVEQYKNINTHKISKITLNDGTILSINNNHLLSQYEDKSFNNNKNNNFYNYYNNDNSQLKKFNSFSSKVRYKEKENNNINGVYVMPITNGYKNIIRLKAQDNVNLPNNNYHVENFTFKGSPKKYNYKPYKQPKRKNKLRPQYTTNYKSFQNYRSPNKNCSCCCNCPGCVKKKY